MNQTSFLIEPAGYPSNSAMSMRIPAGDAGTELTIAAMKALAHDAAQYSPKVKALAASIRRAAEADERGMAEELYWWLTRHISFARDPSGIETLRHPDQMIENIRKTGKHVGDCDELATLAVALLQAVGKFPALIVMSTARRKPFHHVFYGVYDPMARGGPIRDVIPYNPQERTPPGAWPGGARFKAYRV